jgi:hypothetical protein
MKILISEQRDGAATEVAQRLGAAGHSLVCCHAPGSGDPSCVALTDNGRCPLADTDVAVVVDARMDDTAFADTEFVAACEGATTTFGATAHRAVTSAATRVIRRFGIQEQPRIVLRDRHNVVDAFITTGRRLPPSVREATRLAVRAGLAPYTKHWNYAEVIFRS